MKKIILPLIFALVSSLAVAGAYDDLISAANMGDAATVDTLIQQGADPDTTNRDGNTLLMIAAWEGHAPLLDLLLARRAKVNMRNSAGDSALRLAAFKGRSVIVDKLIAAGAHVNTPDWTPLIYAALNGHLDVAKTLLKAGADIDAASANGTTALMAAARGGHEEVVKFLIGAKAKLDLKTENDETALDLALRHQNTDIAERLRRSGGHSGKSVNIRMK